MPGGFLAAGAKAVVAALWPVDDRSTAISFQFTTLYTALTASIGPDVMLQISRPDLPVVVRSADDTDFTTMVMPVKAASGPDIKENREQAL